MSTQPDPLPLLDDEQPVPLGGRRFAPNDPAEPTGSESSTAVGWQPTDADEPRAEPAPPRPGRRSAAASASDFSSERMLRPQAEPPSAGFRRALFRVTGGLINLGPSAAELRERELAARVKAPVAGCRRIAVVSRKGGVGKTTTTLMLGHTFASLRGDRVIALDGNPDAGSLGYRVRRETTNTVMSLLAHREQIQRYGDIRAFTSQAPTRLEVVAADDDPRITDALVESDFHTAVRLLEVHYNLVCLDTGTGVLESAAKGILHPGRPDRGRHRAFTGLRAHGVLDPGLAGAKRSRRSRVGRGRRHQRHQAAVADRARPRPGALRRALPRRGPGAVGRALGGRCGDVA